MNPSTVLYNRHGRPRSGWRAITFLFVFILTAFVLGSSTIAAVESLGVSRTEIPSIYLAAGAAASLVSAIAAGWLCGRWLEALPFRALGAAFTQGWLRHLLWGLLLGGAAMALAAAIGAAFGGLSFRYNAESTMSSILTGLILSFLVFAVAAAWEEAFFRGYILQTFSRAGLAWMAIILTAVFFGSVHLRNPNAGYISSINTALAGIWFGAAYLRSRDLWLPWGLHLAWNWTQGSIFGVEVSGLTDLAPAPLLREADAGPFWLTGGDYGIEGGIAGTIAVVAAIAAVYLLPIADPSSEMLTFTGSESHGLDLERDVDRPGRVGEAADRDEVNTRLGE